MRNREPIRSSCIIAGIVNTNSWPYVDSIVGHKDVVILDPDNIAEKTRIADINADSQRATSTTSARL